MLRSFGKKLGGYRVMSARNKYLVDAHGITKDTYSNQLIYYNRFFKKGQKLLDLGCSTGRFVLCDPENITGVEHDGNLVKYGQEHGLNIVQADINAERLPFEDNTFDGVNMRHIIEHFHDPEPVLKEVYRVLKFGGKVVVWTPDIERTKWCFWNSTSHYSPFTKRKAFKMAQEVGFKDIQVSNSRLSLTGLGWLARRGINANKVLDSINWLGIKDRNILLIGVKAS